MPSNTCLNFKIESLVHAFQIIRSILAETCGLKRYIYLQNQQISQLGDNENFEKKLKNKLP